MNIYFCKISFKFPKNAQLLKLVIVRVHSICNYQSKEEFVEYLLQKGKK